MTSYLLARFFQRGASASRFYCNCNHSSASSRYASTLGTFQQMGTRAQQHGNTATSGEIHLAVDDTGLYRFKAQDEETALKTSQLLQDNHDNHHVFFNTGGFHNHIAHHLLTLYALGAPMSVIEEQYKANALYQLPAQRLKENIVQDMSDPENFKKYLGKGIRYHDFLVFFQREIESKGWEETLKGYMFAGTEMADDFLVRMFGGFLHPIIHLGFGIEFNQPAIIAEAMAQAAVHANWMGGFLLEAERAASSRPLSNKTLPRLLAEIKKDNKLSQAAQWDDGDKIRDGILKRAPGEAIKYASQWRVKPEDLDLKTAEMYNAAAYFAACAQRPLKQVKFDFFYMHSVNSSVFWPTFNKLGFLSVEQKVRLLEWKGRTDLMMYVSRGSPDLLLEEVSNYVPKQAAAGDAEWRDLFTRAFATDDDGHIVKLLRAVAVGEILCGKIKTGEEQGMIRGPMWRKFGNMVIDSVEDEGEQWVRNTGFAQAWVDFKDRKAQVKN